MLKIPYVSAPKNACALACYTMIAKYYFPETTFNQIAKISDWEPGYIVWSFNFWKWIMDKRIQVTDYDLIDYEGWAKGGIEEIKKSLPEKEFNFYKDNTKGIARLTDEIKIVLQQKNFHYHKQKPTFENLREAIRKGNPCEVVLDSRTLNNKEGFSLHRVVVLDVDKEFVTFHDPSSKPHRKETIEHFSKAWLEAVEAPELCVYSKI
jgi:hypothetical protein